MTCDVRLNQFEGFISELSVVFLSFNSVLCWIFQTNEKGQVVTKTSLLKQMEELIEEPGLTCCICREGYKFQVIPIRKYFIISEPVSTISVTSLLFCSFSQPTKVLGIYTFTKRINLEDFENKPRKQQGYSTVSHFNIVHYDCHLAAVRYVLHSHVFSLSKRHFGSV